MVNETCLRKQFSVLFTTYVEFKVNKLLSNA